MANQKILALIVGPKGACYRTASIERLNRSAPTWEEAVRIFRVERPEDWATNSFPNVHDAAASLGVRFSGLNRHERLDSDILRITVRVKTKEVVPFKE